MTPNEVLEALFGPEKVLIAEIRNYQQTKRILTESPEDELDKFLRASIWILAFAGLLALLVVSQMWN